MLLARESVGEAELDQDIADPGARPVNGARGRITVVRHGRPALSRKVRLDWRGFDDWWTQYDLSGLADGEAPPPALVSLADQASIIAASTLKRATETAVALSPDRAATIDAVFVEAPLPAPRVPGVKMGPGGWGVFSRVAWMLGFEGGQESQRLAKRRAVEAAEKLADLSSDGDVLLCAHGWFNRMIGQVLVKRGWRRIYHGGSNYWAWSTYEWVGPP